MAKSESNTSADTLGPQPIQRFMAPAIIVVVALAIRFVPGWTAPYTIFHFAGMGVGPLLGVLGLLVWWVFARGLPRA